MKQIQQNIIDLNIEKCRGNIKRCSAKCCDIIRRTLELAESYGHNKIDLSLFDNQPVVALGLYVKDIYPDTHNCLNIHLYDSEQNIYMSLIDLDVWYLLDIVEFIETNLDAFIVEWSK